MKEKILEALKTKYKTLGLGDSAFDGVAGILEKTVTDESQIETAISGVEDWLKIAQGEGDRVRNDKSAQAKQTQTAKANGNPNPEPTPNPTPQGGGNTQEESELVKTLKAIQAKQDLLEQQLNASSLEKVSTSRKSTLEAILKDAPEAYKKEKLETFGLMNFKDDDSFNAYTEQIKATANELSLTSSSSRPFGGGRSTSKEASATEVDAVVSKLQI